MKHDKLLKEASHIIEPYCIPKGEKFRLKDFEPADTNGINLLSTYGRHDTVGASLYEDPVWGLRDQQLLASAAVDYLWVDLRMSQQLPAEGGYYPGDPDTGKHTAPLPRAGLTKFDGVPGVSRVYDSGDIEIYDMRGA